ncbi:hypothetical protein QQS21_008882 [Conoideocrella luteorostrata]|uniref:LEA domain protein n=1 Tax=Conoideocrella luteorostrata TaxID=1105319 RepID=A0AAJ0CI25_9HYPO|nr:hypothetical protein QQS21_008882 [Conoideocrella luteorostrata]
MYNDISKPPPPLPSPQLVKLLSGTHILKPLSRRGEGPGIILLTADYPDQLTITNGVPSPILKWAEEGYVVTEIPSSALKKAADQALYEAIEVIKQCDKCTSSSKVGLVAYDSESWNLAAPVLSQLPEIVGAAVYAAASDRNTLASTSTSALYHFSGCGGQSSEPARRSDALTEYFYPAAKSKFAIPFQQDFNYNAESLSHTRNLKFLKPLMGGPYFDLESIWDEHTYYEFADRSVEHTMSTMVAEPYVNHVPTLTGGVGRERLTKFYRDNFIFSNSDDTELELISRTVGVDRVIDEFIFKMTHDQQVDWLLPGVPPTGLKLALPFTAVVNIRGDRLYHEHISWDQGTALRQLGLLPEYLPFPHALPGGSGPSSQGKRFEYKVPVLGIETADKMRDKNCVESNSLFGGELREV